MSSNLKFRTLTIVSLRELTVHQNVFFFCFFSTEFSPDGSDDVQSDASETSDMSEVSKVSTISVRSTQSERPRKFRYKLGL